MKIPQVSNSVDGQVVVDSTDIATILSTRWLLAAGATDLAAWWDQRAMQGVGTLNTKLRYRFAQARTEQPGDWTTSTTARNTEDQFVETVDISATTDQMWIQVALGGYYTTGIAEAFVRMQSQVQGKGVLVATEVVEVNPSTNSGQSSIVFLGKRFPQIGITKLMFAYIFKGVSGTITYRPVHREFKGDPELPATWTNLGAGDNTVAADGTANSGLLTVTPTAGYMFGQAGLKFSGDAKGTITIMVAAIY